MFKYRVYDVEGYEFGEAAYPSRVKPGETIWLSGARRFRVVSVVDTHGQGKYEGILMVDAAG